MTGSGSVGRWAAAVGAALLALGGWLLPVEAGETSLYLKSGWFTWSEKVNGNSFVKEQGALQALGVTRRDDVSLVSFGERVEVWGGNLDYDGHDLTGVIPVKSDTNYFGTREEIALSVRLFRERAVSLEPLLAVGHKFWVRTRSDERWNNFYGKAGAAGELVSGGLSFFLKGGAILPIYTRNHATLSTAGLQDVVLEPRQHVSAFAEGGVKAGAFTVSVEYEGLDYGASPQVPTHALGTGQGSVVVNGYAYQPPSSSSYLALKVGYTF